MGRSIGAVPGPPIPRAVSGPPVVRRVGATHRKEAFRLSGKVRKRAAAVPSRPRPTGERVGVRGGVRGQRRLELRRLEAHAGAAADPSTALRAPSPRRGEGPRGGRAFSPSPHRGEGRGEGRLARPATARIAWACAYAGASAEALIRPSGTFSPAGRRPVLRLRLLALAPMGR